MRLRPATEGVTALPAGHPALLVAEAFATKASSVCGHGPCFRGRTSTTVPGSSCTALQRGEEPSGAAAGLTGSSTFLRTLRKRALQKGQRFSISAHRTMHGKQNLRRGCMSEDVDLPSGQDESACRRAKGMALRPSQRKLPGEGGALVKEQAADVRPWLIRFACAPVQAVDLPDLRQVLIVANAAEDGAVDGCFVSIHWSSSQDACGI